jgi:hypothetical protein
MRTDGAAGLPDVTGATYQRAEPQAVGSRLAATVANERRSVRSILTTKTEGTVAVRIGLAEFVDRSSPKTG